MSILSVSHNESLGIYPTKQLDRASIHASGNRHVPSSHSTSSAVQSQFYTSNTQVMSLMSCSGKGLVSCSQTLLTNSQETDTESAASLTRTHRRLERRPHRIRHVYIRTALPAEVQTMLNEQSDDKYLYILQYPKQPVQLHWTTPIPAAAMSRAGYNRGKQ